MALDPIEIQRFGGWQPNADPKELGWAGATDLSNVDIDLDGRLRTRDGLYAGPDSTKSMHGLYKFPKSATSTYTVSFARGTDLQLYYYDSSVTAASGTWGTTGPYVRSAPLIGTPTSTIMFITSGASSLATAEQLKKWTGPTNAVASSSVNTKPLFAARTPTSNRLALGGFINAADAPGGSNGSLSTVFFSDAGAPETFTSTNYVHLTPGDGERITGMATYRDFLLVFKETKFFVFYGESTDETGNPVFNYRTVDIPDGRITTFAQSFQHRACTGRDGVYFATASGIYVTDGGSPRKISGDLDVVFERMSGSARHLYYGEGRLYATLQYIPDGELTSTTCLLVYDVEGDYFLKWAYQTPSTEIQTVGPWEIDHSNPEVAVTISGASEILRFRSVSTDDDGASINAYYYTGEQRVSPPGAEGVIREVLFEGEGTFTAQLTADGTASTQTSPTASSASAGRYRKASRGRSFQLKLGTVAAPWELSRITANVLPGRSAGAS